MYVILNLPQSHMMGEMIFMSPSKALISSPIRSFNLVFNIHSTAKFSRLSSKIPKSGKSNGIEARDRVIDFGRYKGKMLGSLPSTYLEWVSKNLRAGETEEWAKLADQVLEDSVYRDRIEWEAAEKILKGDAAASSSSRNGSNAVSELLEMSERFGWDNEDKGGWSRIDFGLLGTSNGGRIPRVSPDGSSVSGRKEKKEAEEEKYGGGGGGGGGKRRERRERAKRRVMSGKTAMGKRRDQAEEDVDDKEGRDGGGGVVVRSPFPGREALLKKLLLNRR